MRTYIVVFAIFSIANGLDQEFIEEFMEKIQEYGTQCAEEVHATADDIAELINRQIPPSSHEGRCMIFCIQTKFNVMNKDGSLNRTGAMAALKPLQKADAALYQKVLKVFVTCGMRVKPVADPCETASLLAACAKGEAEAAGLDQEVQFM